MNADTSFGVAGRIKAFDQRNGGNPVLYGEWFFHENGAVREYDPMGALIDPPEDEYARLTNIVNYHKGRLAQAVRSFDTEREQLLNSACPDGEALDRLKQLQTVVAERNAAVEEAKAQLAQTEYGRQLEANRQADAEQRQHKASFREDVRAVRI